MLKRLLDFLLRRTPDANLEREMFLTHTPTFFAPGKVHDGMVITRREQVGDTALIDGGRAPCWRIWGREVTACTKCGAEGFRLTKGLCDGCHDAQKTANDEAKRRP
jgi:hypothetical protein